MTAEQKSLRRPQVHPTAVVSERARLGDSVQIGPFCVIGDDVELEDGVVVHSHAVVEGHTVLGAGCEVFPFAAVGTRPQDLKYDGSPTRLIVGARTIIREYATLQPGTSGKGSGVTRIGEGCLIMAYAHIAHDCELGDGIIVANAAQIAGHCTIEDYAIIGGVTTVHQFVRIGTRAITGASARVQQDVPPYTMADGHPARLYGLNSVGLRRARFSKPLRRALKKAYKDIFVRNAFREGLALVEGSLNFAEVKHFVDFIKASERGVARAASKHKRSRRD